LLQKRKTTCKNCYKREKLPVKIVTKEIMENLLSLKNNNKKASRCNFLVSVIGNEKTGKVVEKSLINLKTGKKKILYRDYNDKIFKHLKKEKKKWQE